MPSGLSRTTSASTPEAAVAVARLLDEIRALGHFGSTTMAMRMWLSARPVPGGPRPVQPFQAAGECWLISPPRTRRRRILPRTGWSRVGAAEHRNLMPQYEELNVPGGG